MAEAEDKSKKEAPKTEAKEAPKADAKAPAAAGKIGMMTWVILAVIVLALAGSGFFLGRILAGGTPADTNAPAAEVPKEEKPKKVEKKEAKKDTKKDAKKDAKKEGKKGEKETAAASTLPPSDTWYFDGLESVVVNPDEPGATRYVRVGLNLEMGSDFSVDEATELITSKKPLLINWLNLYFKSLTLSQMQNDRDMRRILSQICDAFNEILFPDEKPKIKKILIREFNIQ